MGTLPSYPAAADLNDADLVALWQNGAQRTATVAQLLGPVVSIRAAVTAIEAISAGAFVNIIGTSVRNAIASDPDLFANGYVLDALAIGNAGYAYGFGLNTAVAVGAGASEVWLSDTTPGAITSSPPTATGCIVQPLGPAIPGVGVLFFPQARVIL